MNLHKVNVMTDFIDPAHKGMLQMVIELANSSF